MERQWSLEDFNSMWKLGAGFPRNDSENAFQDFLKRIPSTTNLAAQAGQHLDQQQQAQLQQQVQHFQQQSAQQQGIQYSSAPGQPGSTGDTQQGAAIPRVPSLDFLRQLVGHQFQQSQYSQPHVVQPKQEPPPAESKAPDASQPQPPVQQAPPPVQTPAAPSHSTDVSNTPVRVPTVSSSFNPAVAAAAIQLGQLQNLQFGRTQGQEQLDKESVQKAEVRRARRMLSNRESARRSRRRKQEHLSTLEDQLNDMQRDKDELFERLQRVEGGAAERERELHRLRQENLALKQELEESNKRPASSQKGIPRSGSLQHIPMAEQPPRKRLSLAQMDRESPMDRPNADPPSIEAPRPPSVPLPPSNESNESHLNGISHTQEAHRAMQLAHEEGSRPAE